ncbi:MAG: glycosyltransferase [Firmicutes bacterium]|nr:glycosyltransferase [Bacillota bacterium]
MKISFFDDEPEIFPLQYGGKARTILNLAREFAKHPDVESVTILSRSIISKSTKFKKYNINFEVLTDDNTISKIVKAAEKSDILNIHCCSFTFPNMECKAKKIYFLHDVLIATAEKGSHLDKSLGGNFDAILAPSEFAQKEYEKNRKKINGKINCFVIPRHINNEIFCPISKNEILKDPNTPFIIKEVAKKYKRILFFPARPIEEKGSKYLLELAKYLDKFDKETCIIGIFDKCKNFPTNCINVSWIESEKLKYYYSIADVTLNFSLLPESFSQICIESVYCKTPVVSFKSGNIPYLNKKNQSIILTNSDLKSICDSIKQAYRLKDDSTIMLLEQKEIEKNYSKEIIVNEYINFYKKMIGGK